jgi:hypothetical protein
VRQAIRVSAEQATTTGPRISAVFRENRIRVREGRPGPTILLVQEALQAKPPADDCDAFAVKGIDDTSNRNSLLIWRIKSSIFYSMKAKTLSSNQLAALSALIAAPAGKAKASITLSGNLLRVVDTLAGAAQRSAWIERAVQSYATRQLKEQRRERELALLNRYADALNAEGDDSAAYQASWTAE